MPAKHQPQDRTGWRDSVRTCGCGSNLPRRDLTDARGIFAGFVCDACETDKRRRFRPDIFDDPNYPTSEPVEDE